MADRYWVAEECASRVADSFEEQTILIDFGLGETALYGGVRVTCGWRATSSACLILVLEGACLSLCWRAPASSPHIAKPSMPYPRPSPAFVRTPQDSAVTSGEGAADHVRWWRRMRLLMLRHRDRLDTLSALHKG